MALPTHRWILTVFFAVGTWSCGVAYRNILPEDGAEDAGDGGVDARGDVARGGAAGAAGTTGQGVGGATAGAGPDGGVANGGSAGSSSGGGGMGGSAMPGDAGPQDACAVNACGGCGTLAAAPGSACGQCGKNECSADKSSVTCVDPGRNVCMGCGTISVAPGTSCGACGTYVCSTDKTTTVCNGTNLNACGGCSTLSAAPGAACGACGTYVCSGDKNSVSCSDPGLNACGGCGTLSGTPNAPCGACGKYVCGANKTTVTCSDPGANACGGCTTLGAAPGGTCGSGGCGKYVCASDKNSVSCSDPSAGGCCIGGNAVASGAVKPDNTCQGCITSSSTTNWSNRSTCGNGNSGCSCSGGTPRETSCGDAVNNDGDSASDCADSDCNNAVCSSQTGDARVPSADHYVTYDERGNDFQINGTTVLSLYRGGSGGPHAYQWSYVWVLFHNLAQNTGVSISKATLRFTYTSTSSQFDDPAAPTTVSIKDSRYIGFDDPALCTISLAVRSSTTIVNCDVTSTVQGWFANSVPAGQRGFRIGSDTYGDQDVNIPANEGQASTAPRLILDYTGRCANNVCPSL